METSLFVRTIFVLVSLVCSHFVERLYSCTPSTVRNIDYIRTQSRSKNGGAKGAYAPGARFKRTKNDTNKPIINIGI